MRREEPVNVDLPELSSATDAARVVAALIAAVASGELLPAEGKALGSLVEQYSRARDIEQLQDRIAALEAELGGRK